MSHVSLVINLQDRQGECYCTRFTGEETEVVMGDLYNVPVCTSANLQPGTHTPSPFALEFYAPHHNHPPFVVRESTVNIAKECLCASSLRLSYKSAAFPKQLTWVTHGAFPLDVRGERSTHRLSWW